jgi:hypothetical protein
MKWSIFNKAHYFLEYLCGFQNIAAEIKHCWPSTEASSFFVILGKFPPDSVLFNGKIDCEEFGYRALDLVKYYRRQTKSHQKAVSIISGALKKDTRFAFYLRSFSAEAENKRIVSTSQDVNDTLMTFRIKDGENVELLSLIDGILPVVQLSNQASFESNFPSLTTRRRSWQKVFRRVGQRASLIVVDFTGGTSGVKYEIEQIVSAGWTGKTIILSSAEHQASFNSSEFHYIIKSETNHNLEFIKCAKEIARRSTPQVDHKAITLDFPIATGLSRRLLIGAYHVVFHESLSERSLLKGFESLGYGILLEDHFGIAVSLHNIGKLIWSENVSAGYAVVFLLLATAIYVEIGRKEHGYWTFSQARIFLNANLESRNSIEKFMNFMMTMELKKDTTFSRLWVILSQDRDGVSPNY